MHFCFPSPIHTVIQGSHRSGNTITANDRRLVMNDYKFLMEFLYFGTLEHQILIKYEDTLRILNTTFKEWLHVKKTIPDIINFTPDDWKFQYEIYLAEMIQRDLCDPHTCYGPSVEELQSHRLLFCNSTRHADIGNDRFATIEGRPSGDGIQLHIQRAGREYQNQEEDGN